MKILSKASIMIVLVTLVFSGCKKSHDDDHLDIGGFRILMNNEVVVQQSGTVVTGQISLDRGQTSGTMTVEFRDPEGNVLNIPDNGFSLQVTSSTTSVASTQQVTGSKWSFQVVGVSPGQSNLTISLMHGKHADFESRPITVNVLATDPS
jgi:hypothetical protein